MNSQEVFDQYGRFVIGNYTRQPLVIVRAEGSQMWDLDGRRYLDLFPGWGCSLLGHCHPRVVEAIREQAGRLIHIDNTFYTLEQGRLAELISEQFRGKRCAQRLGHDRTPKWAMVSPHTTIHLPRREISNLKRRDEKLIIRNAEKEN